MERLRTIIAVIDPSEEKQISLEKALPLARKTKANIIAYLCDYLPHEKMTKATSVREGRKTFVAERKAWLQGIIDTLDTSDVMVEVKVEYGKFWYTAVLRAASRLRGDLIIKSTEKHSKSKRLLTKTSDYTLLRRSPCPVLLARDSQPWQQGKLLAALDLESEDEGHFRLNSSIMHKAHFFHDLLGLDVHIVSACNPKGEFAQLSADDSLDDGLTPAEQVGEYFDVPTDHIQLIDGPAVDVITKTAKDMSPDMIIIGTVARTGVKGILVGNTAERILDGIDCDILAIS